MPKTDRRTLHDLYEAWQRVNREATGFARKLAARGASSSDVEKAIADRYGRSHHWPEALLGPIAERLEASGRFARVEVLGPFGLGPTVAVHAYRHADDTDAAASANFRPDLELKMSESCLGLVDLHADLRQYPPGSMGECSGLNQPTVPIPMDTPIDDVNYWSGILYRHE